jgi:hypothetical protein
MTFRHKQLATPSTYYGYLKDKYDNTVPIRGRAYDVRPIGERRKTLEQIVRVVRDGEILYGGRFHDTNVFLVRPNGNVIFAINGWETSTTRDFICERFHFAYATLGSGRMWIQFLSQWANEDVLIPLRRSGELEFALDGDKYRVSEHSYVTQEVVDRKRTKIERERVRPFLEYCKTMLSLSDGFIGHETIKPYLRRTRKDIPAYLFIDNMAIDGLFSLLTSSYISDNPVTYERTIEFLQDEANWDGAMYTIIIHGNRYHTADHVVDAEGWCMNNFYTKSDVVSKWFDKVLVKQKIVQTTRRVALGTRPKANIVV